MSMIPTKLPKFSLRIASPADADVVVCFMKKLGVFQKMADEIIATPERIERLLSTKQGEAVFGDYDGETIGFAYFHEKSSAFTGRSGLFIDGFLIDESMRGKGLGNVMMHYLSKHALERGCEMLEWGCLDWNTPAIEFYQNMGAYCIDTMRIYRLSPDDLKKNAMLFMQWKKWTDKYKYLENPRVARLFLALTSARFWRVGKNENLTHSELLKVMSHVQREKGEWILHSLMVEGCDVPFNFERKGNYKNLKGGKVNMAYHSEQETVAGIDF